jgi:hypothetical protein
LQGHAPVRMEYELPFALDENAANADVNVENDPLGHHHHIVSPRHFPYPRLGVAPIG